MRGARTHTLRFTLLLCCLHLCELHLCEWHGWSVWNVTRWTAKMVLYNTPIVGHLPAVPVERSGLSRGGMF